MSELSPSPPALPVVRQPLSRYVWRNVAGLIVSLAALVAAVALLSIYYRQELHAFTEWVFSTIGLPGLAVLLFVSESFVSPLPPDVIFLLISKSQYAPQWTLWIPLFGFISTVGGWVGYFCGRRLAHTEWTNLLFRRFGSVLGRPRSAALVHRYGTWAVVLGAVTPLPFSVMCWTAGMLKLPFARVAWPCLLRVPRFLAFYLAIAHAETFARPFL